MKKVIINNSFGGFGISNAALLFLIKKNSRCVDKINYLKYYDGDVKKKLVEDVMSCPEDSSFFAHKDYSGWLYKGGTIFTFGDIEGAREDEDLIKIVELLGELSYGDSAKLKIIEIPDDVEYEIYNHAGVESIHEKHRIWD